MNYGIGTGDAGVLALLADTTRAGYGSGYGHGPFANFSANAVRIGMNGDLIDRNSRDAHSHQLVSQITQFAFAQQAQLNHFALAAQAQVSQLALQACKCCGDQKAAIARIEANIDCISRSAGVEINLCLTQQSNQDCLSQIAILQDAASNNAQEARHGEILAVLGQIAGALATFDSNGNGHGGGGRGRGGSLDGEDGNGENGECTCDGGGGCRVHVDINSHNTDTRGGGGGIEPEVVERKEEVPSVIPLPTNGNGNGERVVPALLDEPMG